MRKSQRQWGVVVKVLVKTVVMFQAQVMMYKAVVHTVLLYGSGSWVVTDVILGCLRGSTIEWLSGL